MKQLQNNFTTPEQSKRLLELGVPADSADCCYSCYSDGTVLNKEAPDIIPFDYCREKEKWLNDIPCWSVGRLIEIFIICTPYVEIRLRLRLIIEQLIASYEDVKKQGLIDFSKLED